ncbi:MAG: methyl-accepting chemotaxis protein [Chitinivibrionales bacterium]|nr:methyl-accepting chemotaxis protein [Chitinivibrionales bacterium]
MFRLRHMHMRVKLSFVFAGFWVLASVLFIVCLYQIVSFHFQKEIKTRLHDYVAHAAMLINGDEHAQLKTPQDEKSQRYETMVKQLRSFRDRSTDIKFVYTARLQGEAEVVFILDAEESEKEKSPLGSVYKDATPLLNRMVKSCDNPVVEDKFYTDEWGTFLSAYAPIRTSSGALDGIVGIDISLSAVQSLIRTIIAWAIGILFCLTLVVMFLAFFTGRHIAIPIEMVCRELGRISNGDLSKDITQTYMKNRDEIGDMFRAMYCMNESLRKLLRGISSSVQTVAASSSKLSTSSTTIAANAEAMTTQTATVASATEKVATYVTTISTAAEAMSASACTAATVVEEMGVSLNEVAKNCQKELQIVSDASKHARTNREIVEHLSGAAHSIGKITEVINGIADQTNLLALNATIEAASAGDAGKGFAVVANEVKELARQSSQATQNIKKQIEEIQENTTSAVKAIEQVADVIEEVNLISQTIVSAVEEQSATVNEISKNIKMVDSGAQNIAQSVAESAKGLSNVTSTINGVTTVVTDTSSGITEIKTNAQNLATLSVGLQELIAKFKI